MPLIFLLSPTAVLAQSAPSSTGSDWLFSYSNSTDYMHWKSSYGFPPPKAGTGGSGAQIYSSHGFQATGRLNEDTKLQVTVRTGLIWSEQKTSGFSGDYFGITDTSIASTLTYYGIDGFQPFVSLSTNLPTGSGTSSGYKAKLDSDISKIPNFGEGFNLGGTVGANIPLSQSLVGTVSAGYTYRGPYNSDGTLGNQNPDKLDPGDVYTLNASLNWKEGAWSAQASASYAFESRAELAGVDYFKSGNRFTLGGSVGYTWDEAWSSKLNASWTNIARNELYFAPPGAINLEPFNSNGDVFDIGFSTTYSSGPWTVTPKASFLYRDRNAYDSADLSFVPAKTTASVGLGLGYAVTDKANINASLGYTWALEDPRIAVAMPKVQTDVWMIGLGGRVRF